LTLISMALSRSVSGRLRSTAAQIAQSASAGSALDRSLTIQRRMRSHFGKLEGSRETGSSVPAMLAIRKGGGAAPTGFGLRHTPIQATPIIAIAHFGQLLIIGSPASPTRRVIALFDFRLLGSDPPEVASLHNVVRQSLNNALRHAIVWALVFGCCRLPLLLDLRSTDNSVGIFHHGRSHSLSL